MPRASSQRAASREPRDWRQHNEPTRIPPAHHRRRRSRSRGDVSRPFARCRGCEVADWLLQSSLDDVELRRLPEADQGGWLSDHRSPHADEGGTVHRRRCDARVPRQPQTAHCRQRADGQHGGAPLRGTTIPLEDSIKEARKQVDNAQGSGADLPAHLRRRSSRRVRALLQGHERYGGVRAGTEDQAGHEAARRQQRRCRRNRRRS